MTPFFQRTKIPQPRRRFGAAMRRRSGNFKFAGRMTVKPVFTYSIRVQVRRFFAARRCTVVFRHACPTPRCAPRETRRPLLMHTPEAFDLHPQPMWIYDLETLRFLAVNDAAAAYYGYSRADFLDLTTRDICPVDAPRARPEAARPAATRRQAGQTSSLHLVSQPLTFQGRSAEMVLALDAGGRGRAAMLADFREILLKIAGQSATGPGERNQAGRQPDLLEAGIAHLNDIVLIAEAGPSEDSGLRIAFVNDAFERLTGYRRADVLGKSPRFLQGPLTDPAELERIRQALGKWQPLRSELVNYAKSGEAIWIEFDIAPVAGAAGRYTHWVAAGRDITERRQAQQALHKSEQRFKSVARTTTDTIWDWDLVSDRIWWNEGMQSVFGYTSADLPADSLAWARRIHPDDHERVERDIHQAIDSGKESWSAEYRFQHQDGRYAYVLDRGSVIRDNSGRAIRMIGGMANLTTRKEAELELARLNRALHVRSACNEALIRATDESELLHEICRIAVDVGGYRMAWVGFAQEDAAQSVRPMAHAGDGAGYLHGIQLSWSADKATGRGPVGRALRSGEVVIIEDLTRDPGFQPWLDAALRHGYRSLVVLPLHDAQRTYGIFALFAPEVAHIGADEMRLLQELTGDLAFGIAMLRSRRDQNRRRRLRRHRHGVFRGAGDQHGRCAGGRRRVHRLFPARHAAFGMHQGGGRRWPADSQLRIQAGRHALRSADGCRQSRHSLQAG